MQYINACFKVRFTSLWKLHSIKACYVMSILSSWAKIPRGKKKIAMLYKPPYWKVQIVQFFFVIIGKPSLFSTVAMKGSKYRAGRI